MNERRIVNCIMTGNNKDDTILKILQTLSFVMEAVEPNTKFDSSSFWRIFQKQQLIFSMGKQIILVP